MTEAPRLELVQGMPFMSAMTVAISEGLISNGVVSPGDLEATPGANDLEVDVSAGSVSYSNTVYTLSSATTVTLSEGPSPSDEARWDTVVYDTGSGSVEVLEGTPDTAPSAPFPGTDHVVIAFVYVQSAPAQVSPDTIFNWRAIERAASRTRFDGADSAYSSADVAGALNEASEAASISGHPIPLSDLDSPFALPSITDLDLNGNSLTDSSSSDTVWDASNGHVPNESVEALVNLGTNAFSQYPLAIADLASPFGLSNITDMDAAGSSLVDTAPSTDVTVYDATDEHIPNAVVEALANLSSGDDLSGYPLSLGSDTDSDLSGNDLVDGGTTVYDSSKSEVPIGRIPDARSNYVLVEDVSDLPPVSGGTRTLAVNTLYEVNGTIQVDAPIEFDAGSMIIGSNWGVDILSNNHSGPMFQNVDGAGVHLRNLTITAGSGQVYDLIDTQNADILIQSVAHQTVNDLGLIDGFRVPTFISCAFDGLSSGLTLAGSMEKVFVSGSPIRNPDAAVDAFTLDGTWSAALLTMTDVYAKAFPSDSRVLNVSDSSAVSEEARISIDLDSVPNPFSGVSPETRGWRISGTGIKESGERGGYYFNRNTTATTISTQDAWVDIGISTTATKTERFTHTSPNTLTYDDPRPLEALINVEIAASPSTNNEGYEFAVFKNGSVVGQTVMNMNMPDSGGSYTPGVTSLIDLVDGDELDVRVRCTTGTADLTIDYLQLSVVGT